MFGLKLKSWMEAHLGRPRHKSTSHQNPKRAPKESSSAVATTTTTTPSATGSTSTASSSSCTASTSSTTNSTSSSSTNSSTTTAIVAATISTTSSNSAYIANTTSSSILDHLSHESKEKNSNFQSQSTFPCSVTTSSSILNSLSAATTGHVGLEESVTTAEGAHDTNLVSRSEKNNRTVTGNKNGTELGSFHAPRAHSLGESHSSESEHQQPISSLNPGTVVVVTGSVSNSTSILSGSFSNSLSSPDTGYSTDGYSPKSVYPALSFDSSGKSTTTSKSSYTISSLVSSELHSSKQASLSSGSCSVQNGLDECASPSPSSPALTSSTPFSQSSSSGISSGTSDSHCFPKGQSHETQLLRLIQQKQQQHSIPEDESEKQVIMDGGEGPSSAFSKRSVTTVSHLHQVKLQDQQQIEKSPSKGNIGINPLAKFAPISIEFKNEDVSGNINRHNGKTHRRAESMDARTPSQEDYKPLVEEVDGESGSTGANPSLGMTGAQGKSIRTSFVINESGQIVEFSSYKNAYSICSPRRERTRIKTNPWIILNKRAAAGDNNSHANPNPTTSVCPVSDGETERNKGNMSGVACASTPLIPPLERHASQKVETMKQEFNGESESGTIMDEVYPSCDGEKGKEKPNNNRSIDPGRKLNLEINKRQEEPDQEEEEDEHFEDETGIMDHDSSSSLLYRISTSASASDSGKGTLEPGTNRNSTESSCLLSDSTASTRNSIISHEAEHSSSRSGRSSSGESISSSHHHHHRRHHHKAEDDTLGHVSPTSSDVRAAAPLLFTEHQKNEQKAIHQCATATVSSNSSIPTSSTFQATRASGSEERTFRNAAVATEMICSEAPFPKSCSVSVGVGTTGSTKSSKACQPIMVDKETDILSDWANTDEDGDEDIETDRNDNETVTPAPSSPGTDGDRGLFSQSTSSATDIDFGDSSAATAASSTAVFPPSSLIRQHRYNNNNTCSKSGRESRNGDGRFHDESVIPSNGYTNQVGESASQIVANSYDHHHHHHNISSTPSCYPSVPIIRPVLAAASQHHGPNGIPDSYAYDIAGEPVLVHRGELVTHPFNHGSDTMCFMAGGVPNFNVDDEGEYPEIREPSHHHGKGIARGALGFLRKIFKKGACSSQRHSPDSTKGKKSRGKSDNNLAAVGLGSPLLTISEPLSNPRYSAVLTSKKQINPINSYFLTPTPNSFRRRSTTGTDSSDSKISKPHTCVKTDIIRLPQGPLSPQLHQAQYQQTLVNPRQAHGPHTSSSHSTGSSSSSGVSNGMPQTCSTFLSPGSGPTNFHQMNLAGTGNNNLTSQSNTNSASTSSSVHSLMSTSTSASAGNGNPRPSSRNQSKTPIPSGRDAYYSNSNATSRQSPFMSNIRGNSRSISPPPLIPEDCPYQNGDKNPHAFQPQQSYPNQIHQQQHQHRRESHSQSSAVKGILPYESPRLTTNPPSNATHGGTSTTGATTARMNSPSFNNYSPIHRLVVTGGSHLLHRANPNCPSANPPAVNPSGGLVPYSSSGESPLPRHGANGSMTNNNGNGTAGFLTNSQNINRPNHPVSSASPLINHRYSTNSSSPHQSHHPYSSSSVQQHNHHPQQNHPTSSTSSAGHFFASPSPILRNPRYQYITSSNQNSPVLNSAKRIIIPNAQQYPHLQPSAGGSSNGPSNPNGGNPPLLTTFTPLSSSVGVGAPRESLINNNSSFPTNANTITGSPNLNSSDPFNQRARQAVSSSVSYNEFENLSKSYHLHNNGNNTHLPLSTSSSSQYNHQILPPPQHKFFHKNIHQNHYYSSPIVKDAQHPVSLKQTLWTNAQLFNHSTGVSQHEARQQQKINQNLRFNSFLVRHRQLPQFYHTQAGLQERIYETVDSEDEHTGSDEMNPGVGDYDQDGNEIDRNPDFSLPEQVHHRQMRQCYSRDFLEEVNQQNCEQDFHMGRDSIRNNANRDFIGGHKNNIMSYNGEAGRGEDVFIGNQLTPKGKPRRSKPKSLSASGRPLPRPLVALPMMPGTFLSETERGLLENDKDSDRKYKRLINEAEALLKEISVEKCKRGGSQDNPFRLEDCPQSDPLRRKAYDCWALRRLQQELAGCCASPPVLHRSRLNLQSPSTPTISNNPYLSHFQNASMAPPLPQQVPYMTSGIDNNQNNFEF